MASMTGYAQADLRPADVSQTARPRMRMRGFAPASLFLPTRADGREASRTLAGLIEAEIIPRLMAAHRDDRVDFGASAGTGADADGARTGSTAIEAHDSDLLASLALQGDADALLGHVTAILARGMTVEDVLLDLLAPAARRLGEYWDDDRCDFIDVTMALWRLQEVVHQIADRVPERRLTSLRYRALFSAMPGEQHSFGTMLVDEMFRRAGWLTERVSEPDTAGLLRCVAADWFDMIGLTISCDSHIAPLTSIIVALRNVSANSRVCIMVGGRVFSADPGLAVAVGADGTAPDARLALEVAEGLVRGRERETAACS